MSSADIVILTAMNLEYKAVCRRLTDLRTHRTGQGTLFEVGRVRGGHCRVALGVVGTGNNPAAALAMHAIAEFSPAAVLLTGVAGALRPGVGLGDVVVASQVYAYHGARSQDDGLRARPRVWEIDHGAGQLAQHLIRTGRWAHDLPGGATPKVHFGPIAAGEVLQDSARSAQALWLREHYNDALAVEMEAAGFAQAGHLGGVPVVVVRGISDRADGTKAATDAEDWQPRAMEHAAAFATALAQELVAEGATTKRSGTDPRGGRAQMGTTTTNYASGNARVGVQAGQVYGNITIGAEPQRPVDLATAIAELRSLLKQAHRDGDLDDDTYEAAESELAVAGECVQQDSPRSRSALVLALKKLRGLVGDVAEVAAKLAAVIAIAKGLS